VVHQRAPRMGAMRVRQELQKKGIAPEAIGEAVATLRDTELPRAREVWARRFDALPASQTERAKQARFLMTRGFSGEVVMRVLSDKGFDEDA
jgi:regulatory protein